MAATEQAVARLAQTVRARRSALRLGQQEVAELSGTSVRFVRNLEHGKTTVHLDKVIAVLEVLGLELQVDLRVTE
jgi:y4mF family transcriptional regulator